VIELERKPPSSLTSPKFVEIIKILMIADGGVGKTTLLHRLVTGRYSEQSMTIGVGFASKVMRALDGREVKLQVWDVAALFACLG
jgi:GTPase SAR1 family protein